MTVSSSFLNKKINTSSVVQQVIDALTQAMIHGEYKPGDRIPTEYELSESLGVGRLSIREAIKVLVYYGVLEIRRPEGTFVREGFSDSLIDPMLYGIILNRDDSYTNIKELRLMMEVGVIKLAIKKLTPEGKKRLLEKYENYRDALYTEPIDVERAFEADSAFHDVVSEIGANPLVDKINALVRTLTNEIRHRTVVNMIRIGEKATLLEAHKQICDVIIEGDVERIEQVVERGYFYNRITLENGDQAKA